MKHIFTLCILTFLAVTSPAEDKISIVTGKNGNIFAPGEALTFTIQKPETAAFPATYQILNTWDEAVKTGPVPADGIVSFIPPDEWKERLFRFVSGSAEAPFAILPERNDAEGGDERFGSWINNDRFYEGMFQAGLRIGVTTSYPHWGMDKDVPWRLMFPNKYKMTLTTNLAAYVYPLPQYNGHAKELNSPGLMQLPEAQKLPQKVRDYFVTAMKPLNFKRVASSLGGEFCYLNQHSCNNLRDVHRAYYAAAKEAAPEIKVALGALMDHGPSTLMCLLDGTTPEDFQFDYVAYDICGAGDQVEQTLKKDIEIMKKWGRVVPQWVCETWSYYNNDLESSAAMTRIYVSSLGLNCVEIDWHAPWCVSDSEEEWLAEIQRQKWGSVIFPMYSQAWFRGKNFNITMIGLAHYHVWKKLSFAAPKGELTNDFNLAAYQFRRKDGSYVTVVWTRCYPVQAAFKSQNEKITLSDHLGDSVRNLKGKDFQLNINVFPQYIESKQPVRLKNFRYLSERAADNVPKHKSNLKMEKNK